MLMVAEDERAPCHSALLQHGYKRTTSHQSPMVATECHLPMDVALCRLTHSLKIQLRPVAKHYDFIHRLLGPLVKPSPRVLT